MRMSWKHCLAATVGLALLAPVPAVAQTTGQQQPKPSDRPMTEQQDVQTQQNIIRADRLIGQTVQDRQNDRLGRIDDLALNVQEGKVVYAIVTRGGVWGIGGENVALDWDQIQPDPAARVVRLDQQQLQQARQIDTGQGWPTRIGDEPVGTAGAAPQHRVLPMSNVIGMDVHNKRGERLGRIDEIALQRDGSVSYAVVAHGGFLGMGDEYIAVPWDRLTLDAQRQGAVLDVTQDQLGQAKRFEYRDNWPQRVDWPFGDSK